MRTEVAVGDRTLSLSNLDKVLYPEAGFTKAQVIDYYVRVAPTMIPHIKNRGVTLRRFPNGVESSSFFEKRCPSHRPPWVDVALGPGGGKQGIEYCRLEEVAALAWTANLAALEIHAPMATADAPTEPRQLVFDLDPGSPATIVECCAVALDVREVLASVDIEAVAKTSGSKGLQVYAPLAAGQSHEEAGTFALAVGQLLARRRSDVIVEMAKDQRPGKVFVDWSQNSFHKTTIAPYSLRGRAQPTVSTPVTWDEVADGANGAPLTFQASEVLSRIEAMGDVFEAALGDGFVLPKPQA